jgi:hypothetical protein
LFVILLSLPFILETYSLRFQMVENQLPLSLVILQKGDFTFPIPLIQRTLFLELPTFIFLKIRFDVTGSNSTVYHISFTAFINICHITYGYAYLLLIKELDCYWSKNWNSTHHLLTLNLQSPWILMPHP